MSSGHDGHQRWKETVIHEVWDEDAGGYTSSSALGAGRYTSSSALGTSAFDRYTSVNTSSVSHEERLRAERIVRERLEAERSRVEREEHERAERAIRERLEVERIRLEQEESERLVRKERARLERERVEREERERVLLVREREEAVRRERIEKERYEERQRVATELREGEEILSRHLRLTKLMESSINLVSSGIRCLASPQTCRVDSTTRTDSCFQAS